MNHEESAELLLICGPNGAGKSTLRSIAQKIINIPFVDQDQVVRERNCSYIEAGRIVLRNIKIYLNENQSFGRESTLSSKFDLQLIENAKNNGFKVSLIYIGIDGTEDSIDRVAQRHAKGGHTVAKEDIRRRYIRSMDNLPKAIELADISFVLDNSKNNYIEVARFENGIMLSHCSTPEWFKNTLKVQELKQAEQKNKVLENPMIM